MKRIFTIFSIILVCVNTVFSQQPRVASQQLKEFEITKFDGDVPINICGNTMYGVLVFYSAIRDLQFEISNVTGALVNQMYNDGLKAHILCVLPTEEGRKYRISIKQRDYTTREESGIVVKANERLYWKIDPKQNIVEITCYDKDYKPLDGAKIRIQSEGREERTNNFGVCKLELSSSKPENLTISHYRYTDTYTVYAYPNDKKNVYFKKLAPVRTTGYDDDNKKFHFGIFGGMSVATQTTDSWVYEDKNSARVGYYAGMLFEVKFGKYVSFQPELLFTQKGSKGQAYTSDSYIYTQTGQYIPNVLVNSNVSVHYMEIPFNCVFNIPIGKNGAIFLGTGLYISCGLSGKMTLNPSKEGITFYLSDEEKEADVFGGEEPLFSRFDYGIDFLAGYRYKRFFVRAGYDLGLFNIANGEEADGWAKFKNNCFNLTVGVKF